MTVFLFKPTQMANENLASIAPSPVRMPARAYEAKILSVKNSFTTGIDFGGRNISVDSK
jgi:hypothetical protein